MVLPISKIANIQPPVDFISTSEVFVGMESLQTNENQPFFIRS